MNDQPLNVLGCVPILLNIFFELAHDARGFNKFNLLKNIDVELEEGYIPDSHWEIQTYNCFEKNAFMAEKNAPYALSVVGTSSKPVVYDFFKEKYSLIPEQFISIVHPSSIVSSSATIGNGLQMEGLSIITACVSVGFGVNIKRSCSIGHHSQIGDYVTINPGVTVSSEVVIGKQTMLGAGAVIRDNVTIGENTVIGAGSVVVSDIPSNSIAYGNPCKVMRSK